jgi:hypothetical protein
MATGSVKPEFPPLLPAGFHTMTVAEVRDLCVTPFTSSLTRRGIFDGLIDLVRQISEAGVDGEIWLDGSFLTNKIDPIDVDCLLRVGSDDYDNDAAKRAVIDWASHEDRLDSHSCDSYKWVEYDAGHPLFAISEDTRRYWSDWYGMSRKKVEKGIAVVLLPAVI